jgi:hypothetical protein
MHHSQTIVAFLALATTMVSGCTTTSAPKSDPNAPFDWITAFKYNDDKCTDIQGQFVNLGDKRASNGVVTHDGLLAENILSQHLPRGRIAKTVALQSNIRNGLLEATLTGDVTRKAAILVSCQSGWQAFSFTTTGQYLGEGTDLVQYEQVNYLRQDRSGALLARVLTNAEMKSFDRSGSESSGEKWYRFEPILGSD